MSDSYVISRKIQLCVCGDKEEKDRVYTYLREGIRNQNYAMNQYMSALYCAYCIEMSEDDRKELSHLFKRNSNSKKGSAYSLDIKFAKGLGSTSQIGQKVELDYKNACKGGKLKYGKISLPTYKDTNPLLVDRRFVCLKNKSSHGCGLYHNYANNAEFNEHLYDNDLEIFIKFANNITFKVVFGNPHKSAELRSVFKNIFDETYDVRGSSIEIDGTKIILNLSLSIPKKKVELDENVSISVDLGINIPAMCATNINDYVKISLGSREEFIGHRTKIQAQRRRLQANLKSATGGHGRNKKLKALDQFTEYEKNWVQNYNHYISKKVIDFALKNNAKYINLEQLRGFGESGNRFLTRNWSYYQLQQFIKYKAEKYGIVVRYINPAYTSQVCSCCGHWEEGQRISQSEFVCKNPECKNFGKSINADFNAARNIAKSTLFVDDKDEITEERILEAKQYYGIK